MSVIDMQTMRYINILDRASKVKTRKCFIYNNTIIFAVPRDMMSKAIGFNASNVRKIQDVLGKKVRIIEEPNGIDDAKIFIEDIVNPVRFKSLEVKDSSFILTAGGTQVKATLLGRNKRRYQELDKIMQDTFGMELKIL